MKRKKRRPHVPADHVPADPEKWSEQSKQCLAYVMFAPKEYADRHYLCWRCKKPAVYSAADQKYAYEVKKAYIHQHRVLCPECWKQLQVIARDIQASEEEWKVSNESLRNDVGFLSRWLELLALHDTYVCRRQNTSAKNMLRKLLVKCA